MIDQKLADELKRRAAEGDATVLRSPEFRSLFDAIKTLPAEERGAYGQAVNALRQDIEAVLQSKQDEAEALPPIDVTAPFDVNQAVADRPKLLPAEQGSIHPLMSEIKQLADIFYRMGFNIESSRELDDEYHMFDSLNFPADHPARDDYDTFMTTEGLIAPAHTSTMQNRYLKKHKANLEAGKPIAVLVPDRVFRNEDLDARHEHTFYQHEGIYVDKGMNVGNLMAVLKTFLQTYYGQELDVKTQPFYFPFTEPSFEFAMSCPFCQKAGCSICSRTGWIELLGCGMIHPNVLREAGVDPEVYTGFAWGGGVDRLVMMKYGIDDVRLFHSARLDFLRQF
ncbi:MAG TPA: phenylalanine--tRNA ligase subunit alpha [Candidatus Saccharimonadales bacterium]|nr:phenylalanine--tRNA ligase subunit alpha [Candidatus Saccharimonadales bacterium]